MTNKPTRLFQHPPVGEEVRAIGGVYRVLKELRLPWRGREVLATISAAHFDTSCCNASGCGYAEVAGYIVDWRASADEGVEPITDPAERDALLELLKKTEHVLEVRFIE